MSPASVSPALAGIVIAGGRSTRFGGEKAVAELQGRSLLLWAVHRLTRDCRPVAVNVRRDTQAEALALREGLPVVYDLPGDAAGPLAGVKAGLLWARDLGARTLAVSPCDVPLAPDELFARLLAAAGEGAALAGTAEGPQPLCSVWPITALPLLEELMAGGAHPPIWRTLERLGAVAVRFESAGFANLNTRDDLAALAGRLAREGGMTGASA